MFEILILQRYYNLSDDKIKFQILDQFSFMCFLSLEFSNKVPDSKTVWLFRETITDADKVEEIFDKFSTVL